MQNEVNSTHHLPVPLPPPPESPGQGDKLSQQVKPITICRRSAANEDCGDAVKEVVERMLVIVKIDETGPLCARVIMSGGGTLERADECTTYQVSGFFMR